MISIAVTMKINEIRRNLLDFIAAESVDYLLEAQKNLALAIEFQTADEKFNGENND